MLSTAGCDPSYTVYLTTTVKAGGHSVQNAWVVPMPRRDSPTPGGLTGANGEARTVATAFLRMPIEDPLLVEAPGRPLCVVRPGPAARLEKHGFFSRTEFDATMSVDLDGKECSSVKHGALPCDSGRCTVTRTEKDDAFCDGWVVRMRAGKEPAVTFALPDQGDGGVSMQPERWTFESREGARTAFALVCTTRAGEATFSIAE